MRGIARNGCFRLRHFIARNCAIIANKEVIKYSHHCAELRATELLFHLKINNFNCDLQIYAADTRMEITGNNRGPSFTCFLWLAHKRIRGGAMGTQSSVLRSGKFAKPPPPLSHYSYMTEQ